MKSRYALAHKRARTGKTDYHRRITLLMSKTSIAAIRRYGNSFAVQISKYSQKGDLAEVIAKTKELEKFGWKQSRKNIPAAYLVGVLAARKALKKGIKKAIADSGSISPTKGSKIYACIKGMVDGGLEIPHSKDIYLQEERIRGKHIAEFSKKSKSKNQFSKTNPEKIEQEFEEAKNSILKNG